MGKLGKKVQQNWGNPRPKKLWKTAHLTVSLSYELWLLCKYKDIIYARDCKTLVTFSVMNIVYCRKCAVITSINYAISS